MTRTFVVAMVAAVALSQPAIAKAPSQSCTAAPKAQWQGEDAARAKLAQHGFEVRRLKTEKSCYDVQVIDKAGKQLEFFLNPLTLDIVESIEE